MEVLAMKSRFFLLIFIVLTSIMVLGFVNIVIAGMRKPLPNAGWHSPEGSRYSEWQPGNIEFDNRFFLQDVIDAYGWQARDVDEIKDLLPPLYYMILKDPEAWGPRRINVTAYIEPFGPLWEKYKMVTEKFRGEASIDDDGWIKNYTAGCPFPDPKTGHELLWNFKKRFGEDDRILRAVTIMTNRRGEVRYAISIGTLMIFDGRLTQGENYKFEQNTNNYSRVDLFTNADPYLKGTLSFIAQYNDVHQKDTFWVYVPCMRRTRHLSAEQRADRFPGGQDLMWENWDTFNHRFSRI
jgi:hypothetical protein